MDLNAFLFLSCLSLGVAFRIDVPNLGDNSTTQCQAILMSTETASRLNQFLDMTLNKDPETLDKVLPAFGASRSNAVKANPGEPLGIFLLQTLISMLQDPMKSFEGIQGLLSNTDTPASPAARPFDCLDILKAGRKESGVYEIYPSSKPVKVFCDMETDGGGWTVFLLRNNVSKHVNFTKNWEDYKNGFGDPEQEYWLGNEHLHELTSNRSYVLRMDVKNWNGKEVWGQWHTFSVDSEENKYKLTSTNLDYKGTAYDWFEYHNNMFFSTFDRDNDRWKYNCAERERGGWWYNSCYRINPTGDHTKDCWRGLCLEDWSKTGDYKTKAGWVQLKIRPSQ